MLVLPARDVAALRPWFTPERPGPTIWSHCLVTGHGRCRVDRWPDPRVVQVELPGGNHALRGDPAALASDDLADVAGFVEAPPSWWPILRQIDPGTAVWNRVVAMLPDDVAPMPSRSVDVRRLGPDDTAGLAGLSPEIVWIHETWGGPAGLAAAGVGWAAFVDGRPVSVAVPFYLGECHEDVGVVTERSHRKRGLSTACAAAVVADIRARGHRPTWTTAPDNPGSLAVAARLGFTHVRDDVLYAVFTQIPVDD
ncbi:MAG: GNAT family N-acetyltransferase [Pseudonocardia sp.]